MDTRDKGGYELGVQSATSPLVLVAPSSAGRQVRLQETGRVLSRRSSGGALDMP